ncbi:flagellar type III secretion system pore protein FliP [Woodsholea maritima]|uniref:flagellar type III secretion system pore protein FliP n=1 Tax=Woodsholea maritima TaxID=240237 RepID=UPI00389A8FFE
MLRVSLSLSLMAFFPALLICSTCFLRIIIVLSMIRHAFGMPETPPNIALVALSLFLTVFIMKDTSTSISEEALFPYLNGEIGLEQFLGLGASNLKSFMLSQVSPEELHFIYDLRSLPYPESVASVSLLNLIPAYMIHELQTSFTIGFLVLLPFLLIELIVASILLSLGMMMVPPATISLPIKVVVFVLIEGWALIVQGLVGSF